MDASFLSGSGLESATPGLIALLRVTGLAAGFIDAVVGGGGLLQLPVTLMIPGLSPVQALATNKLASLGTASTGLDTHLTFVGKLQDATEAGIGNLVDADLAKESAKLTALQTKQQLGVQALSIANQGSSILLSLFR